jgi:hypothetical protein
MNCVARLALLSTALAAISANAATITVAPQATNADLGDGTCSFVEAFRNATSGSDQSGGDCASGSSGADTIELAAGSTYTLTFPQETGTGLPRIRSTITINGNGARLERDPNEGRFRLFLVAGDGNLTVRDATLAHGSSSGAGGTVFNHGQLLLERVVIEDSESDVSGGAIHNDGNLTLRDSTIRNASSGHAGGALVNRGSMSIERSLIEGSSSRGAGGGIDTGSFSGSSLTNSTVSGNLSDGLGGGMLVTRGTVTATQVTVAGNAGTQDPEHEDAGLASGVFLRAGALNLNNTLLAAQVDGNNCGGIVAITHQSTVSDDASCSVAASSPPLIAALALNGGPTRTHALLETSAAIDAGDDALASGLTADQRGINYPRILGARVDVGAFESGDTDGLDASLEATVPNPDGEGFGDGNGDGIPDQQQSNVASLDAAIGGGMATLESGSASTPLQNVSAAAAPGNAPSNIVFPYGFFNFTIANVEPGATEEVVLFVPLNAEINGYWKQDRDGRWHNIATSVSQVGNKTRVVFPLTEGGPFDFDNDGSTITDPGGPGISSASPIPTLSVWSALALALALALLSLRRLRH